MAIVPSKAIIDSVALGVRTRANFAGLERQLQDYYRQLRYAEPRIKRANEAAVRWLSDQAGDVLQTRIQQTGRRQEEPQNLLTLVRSPETHSQWTGTRFAFFIGSRADTSPAARYWRVIERGSRYWVERSERTGEGLVFLNGSDGLVRAGANRLAGTSEVRVVSPRRGRRGAQIRRPIPAYRYLETAVQRFESQRIYRDKLREAFAGTPIRFD